VLGRVPRLATLDAQSLRQAFEGLELP